MKHTLTSRKKENHLRNENEIISADSLNILKPVNFMSIVRSAALWATQWDMKSCCNLKAHLSGTSFCFLAYTAIFKATNTALGHSFIYIYTVYIKNKLSCLFFVSVHLQFGQRENPAAVKCSARRVFLDRILKKLTNELASAGVRKAEIGCPNIRGLQGFIFIRLPSVY